MTGWVGWILLVVFAVHLIAFGVLWFRRRQGYYIALVVTFSLLVASVSLGLWGGAPVIANQPLDQWLRFAAWAAAAVSVTWTIVRIRRRRQAG